MARLLNQALRLFALFLLLALLRPAWAEQKALPAHIFIDQIVNCAFPPDRAFFFVKFDSNPLLRIRAVLMPPLGDEDKRDQGGEWLVGTKIDLPRGIDWLEFSIVLLGEGDNYAFTPAIRWDLKSKETFAGNIELLREHILQRKNVLQSWKVQINTQANSLRRLRADADVIADISRIVDIKEETERVILESEAVDKNIINLKQSLKHIKSIKKPHNFTKRELQLNQQISELDSLARNAESTELERKSNSESDLQRKLAMLEDTRFDDIASLERTLRKLEARLERLERRGSGG